MTNDGTELEDGWPQAGNPLDVVETDGDFGTESSLLPELARRALVSLLTNLRFGFEELPCLSRIVISSQRLCQVHLTVPNGVLGEPSTLEVSAVPVEAG